MSNNEYLDSMDTQASTPAVPAPDPSPAIDPCWESARAAGKGLVCLNPNCKGIPVFILEINDAKQPIAACELCVRLIDYSPGKGTLIARTHDAETPASANRAADLLAQVREPILLQ